MTTQQQLQNRYNHMFTQADYLIEEDVNNFRGVSILNFVEKILAASMCERLNPFQYIASE